MAHIFANGILETCAAPGTGVVSLLGAVAGYRPFNLKCSVGDTVHYRIEAVDGANVPTGAYELGRGTYSAANALTRTNVVESSNSNVAVNFTTNCRVALVLLSPNTSAQVLLDWQALLVIGPVGGGPDKVIYENDQVMNNSYSITAGRNAMTVGPFTVATGQALTVPTGSRFVIL